MNHLINLEVNDEERTITKNLLKAYPLMKAAVEIFTQDYKTRSEQYNEFDLANSEGRGTRGDINGRGKRGDVVGNTVLLREERPVLIHDYERKCQAIDMALQALSEDRRIILMKCFLEQKKDKYIYEIILNIPKSTYDYYKKHAIDSVTCILKAASII